MQVGYETFAALLLVIVASIALGLRARSALRSEGGGFLKGYFLGNRGLGSWALALTATVQSGGTFMGFPALVYAHGWIVALWIASYMVVPITGFAILGKRVAQLSRRTGAITAPDLFRERFGDPRLGLVSSLFIIFFMTFMMVAQFKAGAIVMKIAWPGSGALSLAEDTTASGIDTMYYVGLAVFTIAVVGYTLAGGFLAAVWTDLMQSVLMLFGVLVLLPLALIAAGGLPAATQHAVDTIGPAYALGPGYSRNADWEFLPPGLAFSFFVFWAFAGFASPASVVRVMACKNTTNLRRSIFLLNAYNFVIYIPLIMICIAARKVLPEIQSPDEVIPRMALWTTKELTGGGFLAGIILAAPFGAVMSTVSSYLVVISSGLVRDIYQRFIHPEANATELRRMSAIVIVAVGLVAVLANIRPVDYLQAIVVFASGTSAATFCVPVLMTAYWRRATAAGMLAAMFAGSIVSLGLYAAGWIINLGFPELAQRIGENSNFRPYYLLELHPIVWGLIASAIAGVLVSLVTKPPDAALVSRLFDAEPPVEPAPA